MHIGSKRYPKNHQRHLQNLYHEKKENRLYSQFIDLWNQTKIWYNYINYLKKLLKIIVILLLLIIFFIYLKNKPAVPKNYQSTTKTGGEIEKKYITKWKYEVIKKRRRNTLGFWKIFDLLSQIIRGKKQNYPVIVIGTEKNSWNAFSTEMSLHYMHKNAKIGNKKSVFYQKVDFDNAGIVGHSQGGGDDWVITKNK